MKKKTTKKSKKDNIENNKKILIISVVVILLVVVLLLILKGRKKVTYTIMYNGINCPTPYVEFFADGTYNYYEHFGEDESGLKPAKGKYKYDMDKLIKNINNYNEDSRGPYIIELSTGEKYTTYSTNTELRELLDGHNIVLEKCMTSVGEED
jgi:hypothetical protein